MKYFIASDIHGSAYFCERMLEAFEREGAERMILLGDLLYHGPRNPLPDGYAPMEVVKILSALKEKIGRVHAIHRNIWFKYNKDFGFINNDIHYGGMESRIDFAIIKLTSYLEGECEKLDELEEERLEKPLWAFSPYNMIATPTQHI